MSEPNPELTPEPASPVNADGSFTENWHEKYGEDNKAHLSRYKTFDDFVDSHISQRKKFSKDPNTLVEIPTEHSSDEVRATFHKARGKPDTPDDYKYVLSDELAIKLGPLQDAKMTAFKKFAHEKLHLSPSEFKEALDFYHANQVSDIDAFDISFNEKQVADAAAAKTELRKKPGWQSEEEYAVKVQRAQSVMEKYKLVDGVAELNLQNSPKMIEGLNNIADAMDEDTLKGLVPPSGPTRDNIKTQIAEIRSQMDTLIKENPSNYKGNVKFRDLQARKTELYKLSKQMSA